MPKDGIFIVHIKGDLYWVGSSYNRDFQHNKPSKEEYINLTKELSEILKIPFEVVDHLAAIRPTVRDRKPYLGYHPQQKNLLIFNGLGAKGSSLGPYFAAHFADWLNNETDLDREVDISRLKSLRK
jgi:glycine/D-amino acid oxidase-like deaminating enzyme